MKMSELNKEQQMISYLAINYWNRMISEIKDEELRNKRLIRDARNLDIPQSLFDNAKRIMQSFENYDCFILRVQPDKVPTFVNYVSTYWEKYAKTDIVLESELSDVDYEDMVRKKMENVSRQLTRLEEIRLSECFHQNVNFRHPKRSDLESFNLKLERIRKELGLAKDADNIILAKRLERLEF